MYHPQPSPFGAPGMGYAPQPTYTPPVNGTVNPGDTSYGHLVHPDGRSMFQLFRAVPASFPTQQGMISGVQWTPIDIVASPPPGAIPANPEFVSGFVRTHPQLGPQGFTVVPPGAQDPRQPGESRKEKRSKHNRSTSEYDSLQKARDQDRRYQNPPAVSGGVPFPGNAPTGYPAFPGYPPFGDPAVAAPGGYVPYGPPMVPGAYGPDIAQQMAAMDLNNRPQEKQRERKTSEHASKRSRKQSTHEPSASTSSSRGGDTSGYVLPPLVYGHAPPQASSSGGGAGNYSSPYGYPASGSSQSSNNPSPNVPNPKDLGPYGAPPAGWTGNPYATSSSSRHTRQRTKSNVGRDSTSPAAPGGDVYPSSHIMAGQPKSRAASPNPHPAYGYPQHPSNAGGIGAPSPYHTPGVLPSGYPSSQSGGAQSTARPNSRMSGVGAPSPYHPPGVLPTGYPQSQSTGRPRSRMAGGPSPYPGSAQTLPSGGAGPLAAPDCFSRPINAALPYFPFEPINVHAMNNFFKGIMPKLPNVCETHDMRSDDWQRFIEDLTKAWTGQLPAQPLPTGEPPHPSTVAEKVIATWNTSFFEPRGIEVVLYRGIQRRSGAQYGRKDLNHTQLEGTDSDTDEEDTESSSETDSDDGDPYGEGGMPAVTGNPELANMARKRYWEERIRVKQRRRARRERNKRRRMNKKYRLFITCVRNGAPRTKQSQAQQQHGAASAPGAYSTPPFGAPQSSYPGMQWQGSMGPPPVAKSHSRAPSRSGKY
ncbi:hypothetical protein BKA70DRAFT_1258963 [Coprinopsis sp. MPI-PUGE-AT-0042]|nr:hypothetical protein BKA70DRAFT_1258963 [Coprinopsis sp. MPI-PUGE-AT-0042]